LVQGQSDGVDGAAVKDNIGDGPSSVDGNVKCLQGMFFVLMSGFNKSNASAGLWSAPFPCRIIPKINHTAHGQECTTSHVTEVDCSPWFVPSMDGSCSSVFACKSADFLREDTGETNQIAN
jgi:hypothetical protein